MTQALLSQPCMLLVLVGKHTKEQNSYTRPSTNVKDLNQPQGKQQLGPMCPGLLTSLLAPGLLNLQHLMLFSRSDWESSACLQYVGREAGLPLAV